METAVQCLRFFNCDMYYNETEIAALLRGLAESSVPDRVGFFGECLRLRRRERHLWGDTPLAKAFTALDLTSNPLVAPIPTQSPEAQLETEPVLNANPNLTLRNQSHKS